MQESIIKINEQFKTESENYEDNLRLKLHRTLSWLNEAEKQIPTFVLYFCGLRLMPSMPMSLIILATEAVSTNFYERFATSTKSKNFFLLCGIHFPTT